MNEEQTDNIISMDCSDNLVLPVVTADLAKLSINISSSPISDSNKRILRKRIPKSAASTDVLNRRCSLKPKKKKVSEMDIEDENIKEYYLNKKINKKINLETIYEESDNANNEMETRMSVRKFNRTILFYPTLSKITKRRAKIKKVFGSNKKTLFHKREEILNNYLQSLQLLERPPNRTDDFLKEMEKRNEKLERQNVAGQSSSCV